MLKHKSSVVVRKKLHATKLFPVSLSPRHRLHACPQFSPCHVAFPSASDFTPSLHTDFPPSSAHLTGYIGGSSPPPPVHPLQSAIIAKQSPTTPTTAETHAQKRTKEEATVILGLQRDTDRSGLLSRSLWVSTKEGGSEGEYSVPVVRFTCIHHPPTKYGRAWEFIVSNSGPTSLLFRSTTTTIHHPTSDNIARKTAGTSQ